MKPKKSLSEGVERLLKRDAEPLRGRNEWKIRRSCKKRFVSILVSIEKWSRYDTGFPHYSHQIAL